MAEAKSATKDVAKNVAKTAVEKIGKVSSKVGKVTNKVGTIAQVATGVVRVGISIKKDIDNKTTRNTVKTSAKVASGAGGGAGGAAAGAALGTLIFPGAGTIIGGLIGGAIGGFWASDTASVYVGVVGDILEYDVYVWWCKDCCLEFKVKKYKGEEATACPHCLGTELEFIR